MNTRLKSLAIVALGTVIAVPAFGASFNDSDTHKETNFNDGKTEPFVQRTTAAPSYARVVSKRLKCKWFESGWNGSRNQKGAEIWSQVETHNAYFVGFKFRVPKANSNVSFPDDKNTIVHQNMQRTNADGGSTWHAVFEILNNKLVLTRRTGNNDRHTEHTIINSLTRDRDYEIQTRIQPDPDGFDGRIEIWVDGRPGGQRHRPGGMGHLRPHHQVRNLRLRGRRIRQQRDPHALLRQRQRLCQQ